MTTAEIGRAPEYHVDYQNDKKQVRELIDKKVMILHHVSLRQETPELRDGSAVP